MKTAQQQNERALWCRPPGFTLIELLVVIAITALLAALLPVPTNWPRNKSLPGAINMSFFAGQGELVKLDRLWQLYWHRDYRPSARRPGPR